MVLIRYVERVFFPDNVKIQYENIKNAGLRIGSPTVPLAHFNHTFF